VALSDVLAADVEAAAAGAGGVAVPFDVTDEAAVERGFAAAQERLGGLDVVVANAGILRMGAVADQDPSDFRAVIDVNLVGMFLCLRAAARIFREQERGVILATASQAGLHGYPDLGAYCASKFGVIALVETLAKELGPHGIRVVTLKTGGVPETLPDTFAGKDEIADGIQKATLLNRAATLADVGNVAAFVASDQARTITATEVNISCGALMD